MASGYVKPLSFDCLTKKYELTLTNLEVKLIFEDFISNWFYKVREIKNEFIQALTGDNLEGMNEWMSKIVEEIFSFFDVRKKVKDNKEDPENFYHAFVLGLIVDLQDRYKISSNRESGYGRYDVMFIPKSKVDHSMVMEFKTFIPKEEKNLEETCLSALKQIYNKHYLTELKSQGFPLNDIYVYGFAFKGKKLKICGGAYTEIDWNNLNVSDHVGVFGG